METHRSSNDFFRSCRNYKFYYDNTTVLIISAILSAYNIIMTRGVPFPNRLFTIISLIAGAVVSSLTGSPGWKGLLLYACIKTAITWIYSLFLSRQYVNKKADEYEDVVRDESARIYYNILKNKYNNTGFLKKGNCRIITIPFDSDIGTVSDDLNGKALYKTVFYRDRGGEKISHKLSIGYDILGLKKDEVESIYDDIIIQMINKNLKDICININNMSLMTSKIANRDKIYRVEKATEIFKNYKDHTETIINIIISYKSY